jgi:uncharacterized protein YeaO (DUF488 family)
VPAEAIARIKEPTSTVCPRAGIGIEQAVAAPSPPGDCRRAGTPMPTGGPRVGRFAPFDSALQERPDGVARRSWVDVRLKRAYEPPTDADGYRVLIDRLWPRGISRGRASLDDWERELAPTAELRRWFGHDPSRFEEFRSRYLEELRRQRPRIAKLRRRARSGTLTLVYSARDTEHNDAVVLADVLRRGLPSSGASR